MMNLCILVHAKGAIMHHINVNVLDSQQCQQTLQQNFQSSVENVGPSTLCGVSDIDQCRVREIITKIKIY